MKCILDSNNVTITLLDTCLYMLLRFIHAVSIVKIRKHFATICKNIVIIFDCIILPQYIFIMAINSYDNCHRIWLVYEFNI